MKNNTAVLFSTREYESNHGAKPRGQGSWAFVPAFYANHVERMQRVMWFRGTYGEAKRAAAKAFADAGVYDVVVCS